MSCETCLKRMANRFLGVYDFACLSCCAELVLTARRSKAMGKVALAAIGRFREAQNKEIRPVRVPSDDEVMGEVKRLIGLANGA